MSVYDNARNRLAPRLRERFGLAATITREIAGEFDPVTGKYDSTANTTIPVRVAKRQSETAAEGDSPSTATKFTVWNETRIGDVITFAGTTYRVSEVITKDPDGTGLIWIATVGDGA